MRVHVAIERRCDDLSDVLDQRGQGRVEIGDDVQLGKRQKEGESNRKMALANRPVTRGQKM
jgi:hypothetical protein